MARFFFCAASSSWRAAAWACFASAGGPELLIVMVQRTACEEVDVLRNDFRYLRKDLSMSSLAASPFGYSPTKLYFVLGIPFP